MHQLQGLPSLCRSQKPGGRLTGATGEPGQAFSSGVFTVPSEHLKKKRKEKREKRKEKKRFLPASLPPLASTLSSASSFPPSLPNSSLPVSLPPPSPFYHPPPIPLPFSFLLISFPLPSLSLPLLCLSFSSSLFPSSVCLSPFHPPSLPPFLTNISRPLCAQLPYGFAG